MIRENQTFISRINVLSDGCIVFFSLLLSYWIRFHVLPDGIPSIPFAHYVILAVLLAVFHLIAYALLGLYEPQHKQRLYQQLSTILWGNVICMVLLQMILYIFKQEDISRLVLLIFFLLTNGAIGLKNIGTHRLFLRYRRNNRKRILLVGCGEMAQSYAAEIRRDTGLGYELLGYISTHSQWKGETWLGTLEQLDVLMSQLNPDEVVACLSVDENQYIPSIIHCCEQNGIKLSLVPFYTKYISSNPQFDSLNGLPLINMRRIPLDNLGNAFLKRSMDILGSLLLIVLTSPIMLITAIGVKLSSPGPIIFSQKRVGKNNKPFFMYKFRSMRVNSKEATGWSTNRDDRKTRFGSFIRKFSIDELPQFFNVLKGDMSLIGPRPEIPYFVEQFRSEIPRYMVKHLVRPGITGWAQVHGLRGDTSIEERIRHDIYYIENWSLPLDFKILLMTLPHIVNKEVMN